jgi:signal transduction histidine kinase/CheY-like chemotaxis protein
MRIVNPEVLRAISPTRLRGLKALALVAVLAPALVFCAYALVSYDAAFRTAEARAAHIASILQEHAQRVFETVVLALYNTDQTIAGVDNDTLRTSRADWEAVHKIQATGPQLGSLFVVAADGSLVLTTREFPTSPMDFSDRDYFVAQKDRDAGVFLGRSYVGKISTDPIFNFSIRRGDAGGAFNGVIGSSARIDYFHNFYATVGQAEDDFSVLLMRSDGEILVRHPTFTPGDKFDPALLRSGEARARQVRYARSPLDGLDRLFVSAKVGDFSAYVAYSIARDAIVRQWAMSLLVPGAVSAGVTLLLLLLTSFALRRARSEGVAIQHMHETATSLRFEIDRRQKAEASLLQGQKLEAVGRLTGGIAHDFNNLLTIISGNLALAQRRDDVSAIRRLLTSAQYAAQRGAGLTRQLLAFSRGQSLRPVVTDLNDILANAKMWMPRAVTEAIDIQFVNDGDLWPVRIDVDQFEAALLNLVVNARDAMEGRGRLRIEAHNINFSESSDRPPSLTPGDYVAVSFADNGGGMPPDVLAKACEPFFTTKDVGKGTGLGLSQVHGLMKQSGGEMTIISEVGSGTVVTLYVPRSPSKPLPAERSEVALPEAQAPSRRVVLVVEDEEEVRKVTISLLDELGYSWIAARSGREALAILSAGERIDILFTDVVLPQRLDGVTLAKKALELRPSIGVLLATASLDVSVDFPLLPKPFNKEGLEKALGQLVRQDACA